MLTQIYEVSAEDEARAISALGIDHVGVLVGDGRFPRELPLASAMNVARAISPPAKFYALFLTADVAMVATWTLRLRPAIIHLGASVELVAPADVMELKRRLGATPIMRSVPVVGEASTAIAQSYDGIADFILLDSHRANDNQIGALGVTHDWRISRRIVEGVRTPRTLTRSAVFATRRCLNRTAKARWLQVESRSRFGLQFAHDLRANPFRVCREGRLLCR